MTEQTKKELTKEVKKLKREIIKEKANQFKNEFKKSMNTAIIAAFGFLIALTWRDVISEAVNKITEATPIKGKLISAIIITFISVIGIMIITKFLSEEKKELPTLSLLATLHIVGKTMLLLLSSNGMVHFSN